MTPILTPEAQGGAAPSSSQAPAATSNVLNTYEDCLQAADAALKASEQSAKDVALGRIKAFFEKRISKKASQDERDGSGAVKRAVESGRKFKMFTPPAAKADENKPGGGLFT
jgi:hypothetical protein